jgi:hypothetical protein
MSLGPKCNTCGERQSVIAIFLAGRWRRIVCPDCKSILEEQAVVAAFRFGATILASGLVTNYFRYTHDLSRLESLLIGVLIALAIWLVTIPVTQLTKSRFDSV